MVTHLPQTQNVREFHPYYRAILDLFYVYASQIITASPLCIGKDLSSPTNLLSTWP
jgi:hypothetical protein